ncbi:OB-fold domain-containing protein [Kribbella hippodromi]|uniref:OB-fold domain-containing protein n=1 Tax=Kribbella hippodromi TaxID=434347 RepID=A0ABN2E4N0_9ACTN
MVGIEARVEAEPEPYAKYVDLLRTGQIAYQQCAACGLPVFYPRVLCPHCGATELLWAASQGRGVVYSATVVPERDGSSYAVCLVDLDEGFRMMSTVIGVPAESVRIGARVVGRVEAAAADGEPGIGEPRVVFEREGSNDDS